MIGVLAASAIQVCVIVYAIDAPNPKAVYWHEVAHCNGWQHPERKGSAFAKGYRAHVPPQKYLHYPRELRAYPVTTAKAKELCGSLGCQWFTTEPANKGRTGE